MKRVFAVVLLAVLVTSALGIDHSVSASQSGDQRRAEQQRTAVANDLAGMQRGTTATLERKDGTKFDVVIQEITADSVTVLRQIGDQVTSETIPISDIARVKKKSLQKMGTASKVLIVTAVTLGALFVACSVAPANAPASADAHSNESDGPSKIKSTTFPSR